MVRLAITTAACAAIAGTLPGTASSGERAENGSVSRSGPGESYSDVILRLAKFAGYPEIRRAAYSAVFTRTL
jgi:hypothetical protein